jgi:hypothetical protein
MSASRAVEASEWTALEPGLELAEFQAFPGDADPKVAALRIDPARFELRLLSASETGENRTPREWCATFGLAAAINASMYQADLKSSVSLMRTRTHINNPRLSKDNSILVFGALADTLPPVRLLDRSCDEFEEALAGYGTHVQSIRMISCRGENVWSPATKRHSTAAVGVDSLGRVLFLHARSPQAPHDLIAKLIELPLGLERCMYTEGGPQAQLNVGEGDAAREFTGTNIAERLLGAGSREPLPLPNVIGVVRRARREP